VAQTMVSGVSAYLGGILGLGNQVTTNSSACTTGTEAILMGYDRIVKGDAKRMLVGSCSDDGAYLWGGFDAMRVLSYKHNDNPEQGSRPMSATASGFVPGGGAGALVLESLESALKEIDVINGHLTATKNDHKEIGNWVNALGISGDDFPPINSLKSMVGHCLSAAGAIESVACILQIRDQFIFPNINCEDISEEILSMISENSIVREKIDKEINIVAKASFGFGDVNGCVDVVLDIEDKYDIEIDNDSMDKMLNVKASLEVIQEKLSNK